MIKVLLKGREAKMKKIFEEKGIKVIDERNGSYKCIYNDNKIILELCSGLSYCYRLNINGETVIKKGSLMVCINKILNYRKEEK